MDSNSLIRNADKIKISGHRGGKFEYENSLEGFRQALEHGLDEIEFDLWLTKDKIPVVIHGTEGCIGFECESTGVLMTSKFDELTLDQIKSIRLPDGHEIPTFEELLELCANKIFLNIEIKDPNIEICQIVYDMVVERGISNQGCYFTSFEHHVLKEFKRIDSSYECGYLYRSTDPLDATYYPEHGECCNIPYQHLSQELIDLCRAKGQKVNMYFNKYMPEDPSFYPKILELGVDTVICDTPLRFREYVNSVKQTNEE